MKYQKINSIYKREHDTGKFIKDEYSIPEFELLKDIKWEFTEKVDGTNIRVYWQPQEEQAIRIAGRTDNSQIPTFLYDRLNQLFTYEKMKCLGTDIENYMCLYGEGYGAKIQGGGGNYKSDGVDFVLFDVKIGNWWLKREDVENIGMQLGVEVVPIVGQGTLADGEWLVKKGFNSRWGDFTAEGIIAKPIIELKARNGERIITKIKHRDYD